MVAWRGGYRLRGGRGCQLGSRGSRLWRCTSCVYILFAFDIVLIELDFDQLGARAIVFQNSHSGTFGFGMKLLEVK